MNTRHTNTAAINAGHLGKHAKKITEGDLSESIGRHRRTDFIAVVSSATVKTALNKVRESKLPDEVSNKVYITETNGKYLGFVRLSRLLRSQEDASVLDLIEGKGIAVPESEHRETAARKLQRLDISTLPITDSQNRLTGILRFDDAMDILDEEVSDDIYMKAGLSAIHAKDHIRSELLTAGPLRYPIGVRLMFLMVTLAGGLLVGGLVDFFEDTLAAVIALAVFVPLVMDMGGNVGTQSTTIFARGLALGHISLDKFWRKHMIRETVVGLAMAAIISVVAGTIAYFWQGAPNDMPLLGVVVGGALFFSVLTAAILGFLLPYIMLKIGVDHAPGADPFITTIKDFTGLAVYFLLAGSLLGIAA
ncbi:magnesium transporter [Alkalimonas delamerensis]|uniref:Magnesium transporter n=1 Tax=Alkalimonas delamerensis TaxID=265981 RepID=A0ABT9GQ43_9GAMM|nr:magnesium transporter [Alkalimonas delamerensis]MDP4529092.1 magnesium transporter [Alkalimonas delamerensis]